MKYRVRIYCDKDAFEDGIKLQTECGYKLHSFCVTTMSLNGIYHVVYVKETA